MKEAESGQLHERPDHRGPAPSLWFQPPTTTDDRRPPSPANGWSPRP
jgi:hypothetical protein